MPLLNCIDPVDQEWSNTLMEMERNAKFVTLSDIEWKFLENVSILEEMKDIAIGCEVLEQYKELMASCEEQSLWEKIKEFFKKLWKKFIDWIKNIPNWIRPYINRIKDLKSRLGVTIEMDPIPQKVLFPENIVEYFNTIIGINIQCINYMPTLCFNDGTPIHGKLQIAKFVQTEITSQDQLIYAINSIIQMNETYSGLSDKLHTAFYNKLDEQSQNIAQGLTNINSADAMKAFNDDLELFMETQKTCIQAAKNLSMIKTKPLKRGNNL